MKQFYVYMLASGRNGTIYIGVTNDILRRVHEHKTHAVDGFSKRYGVVNLVWFEVHPSITNAIQREKNLKHWSRAWKMALIEGANPTWRDLYDDLAQ
ncbi:MAG: GIY-YIG nuclease family protein [Parvibaculum sp.]|uniref:GIY-YIG nuclease family protein n=1 Tax=Parvibaculum sp. TaxID=2024848 RepID=UPI003C76C10E